MRLPGNFFTKVTYPVDKHKEMPPVYKSALARKRAQLSRVPGTLYELPALEPSGPWGGRDPIADPAFDAPPSFPFNVHKRQRTLFTEGGSHVSDPNRESISYMPSGSWSADAPDV